MLIKIYTLRFARFLIDKGFHCEGTIPNKDKPWLNTYLFLDSQELRQAMTNYTLREGKDNGQK